MKRVMSAVAAVAIALGLSTAANAQQKVKIGVLNDMSGLYRDLGGPGSVEAAKLAVEDFAKINPNLKVEIVSGDHQNKPDIGSSIATKWFDNEGVDAIFDVPTSSVALAVSQVAANKNKVFVGSGPASSDLTEIGRAHV